MKLSTALGIDVPAAAHVGLDEARNLALLHLDHHGVGENAAHADALDIGKPRLDTAADGFTVEHKEIVARGDARGVGHLVPGVDAVALDLDGTDAEKEGDTQYNGSHHSHHNQQPSDDARMKFPAAAGPFGPTARPIARISHDDLPKSELRPDLESIIHDRKENFQSDSFLCR